ncbi:FG-GAP repeat domain-containing protein [Nannocystis pusilla]|uniref:VCBS repeat-containing protein n=1 Tax=Nannocystis pusilla TaxID=889268 RepID=A0ABS7TSN7_9BACT|nr:VCBS repeat-containing protein [Nannocystis pusilla]MBZ5711076.1 VCBS repeat-containing protein [Nannocystis pusilla]
MTKLTEVGMFAGLMMPLTGAPEVRAADFSEPEMWIEDFGVSSGWRLDRHPRFLADVDGDGRADIVGFGEQGVVVALSTGDCFAEPRTWVDNYSYSNGWRVDKHPRFLADVDGDGKMDVVGFGNDGVFVSQSTGSKFRPPKLWVKDYSISTGWRMDRHPRVLVDVTGDELPDIVGFGASGVYVSRSTGTKFTSPKLWLDDFGYDQGWRVDRTPRLVGRVDGDKKADIVGFGNDGVYVARAGDGSFARAKLWLDDFGYDQGWRADKHVRMLGDVDGDGREDIVGFGDKGTLLALARSGKFSGAKRVLDDFGVDQGWRVDRHVRVLARVDDDDRVDIVGFGQKGVIVATAKKDSFREPKREVDEFGQAQGWRVDVHLRVLADVNGDGLLDIVGFGDYGTIVALAEG